jgi:hypothetical protein
LDSNGHAQCSVIAGEKYLVEKEGGFR